MSPGTLIYIKNWCFYKISLIYPLFSTVFYIFNHISVNFNMFLGVFWRVSKRLQNTSLTWTSFFVVFTSQQWKDWTFAVLIWFGYSLFPGLRPDLLTLFKFIQNQKGLISAMRSNGPLTPSLKFSCQSIY